MDKLLLKINMRFPENLGFRIYDSHGKTSMILQDLQFIYFDIKWLISDAYSGLI